jgi:hypothetical protein
VKERGLNHKVLREEERVARSEWSGLSSHAIDGSPKGMGAERPYQSVGLISEVNRRASRRELPRLVTLICVHLFGIKEEKRGSVDC